ncbi:MAG: hypothetical protein ACI8TP_000925, partial [Acidimicrobiales bacterium]
EDIEVAPVPAAAQPTATIGVASSRGVEVSSTRWIVPWVELGGEDGTVLVVSGPEGTLVETRLVVAGELQPPFRASIPASGIAHIVLPAEASGVAAAPIVITADQPVVAEVQVVIAGLRLTVVPAVPVIE